MPLLALSAVLIAALLHAVWNVIAKRAVGSHHFIWLYSVASMLIWAPLVGYVLATAGPPRSAIQWLALAATGVLHLGYSTALQSGYRAADLSIVYPIARGFGPLLSFVGAVLLLGDPYSRASVLGLALILAGMALVSGLVGRVRRIDLKGVGWGLVTGGFIAGYTLNDGWAVKVLLVSPLVVDYFGNLVRFTALLPSAASRPRPAAVGSPPVLLVRGQRRRTGAARLHPRAVRDAARTGQPRRAGARARDALRHLPRRARAARGGDARAPRRRRRNRRRHRLPRPRPLLSRARPPRPRGAC